MFAVLIWRPEACSGTDDPFDGIEVSTVALTETEAWWHANPLAADHDDWKIAVMEVS